MDHLDQVNENYTEHFKNTILTRNDIIFEDSSTTPNVFKNDMVSISINELNKIQTKAKLSEQFQIQVNELMEEIEMLKRENKELQKMVDN